MLRSFFLYISKARWARRIVMSWGVSRRVARRFVAGETLDEAIQAIRVLNAAGMNATLDHLGEAVSTEAEAIRAADAYLAIISRVNESGVRSNASLKLSQLGLNVSYDLCLNNVRRVVRKAAECGLFIRIDMEDTPTVDRTIELWRTLRKEGLLNVGLVFQAYLYRTENDLGAVLAEGCRIRLCKGAYQEPASLAYPRKADVDASYDRLVRLLIDAARAAAAPRPSPRTAAGRRSPASRPTTASASPPRVPTRRRSGFLSRRSSSRCCTGSVPSCSASWSRRVIRCACMWPTERSGIRSSCAALPSARPTCGSLSPTSSVAELVREAP